MVNWWGKWKHVHFAVPDSGALTWWVLPGENEQTPCGKWESGPQEAVSSVVKVSHDAFKGEITLPNVNYLPCTLHITLIATSSCSASCSIPKNRASSRTPGRHLGQYQSVLIFKSYQEIAVETSLHHLGFIKRRTSYIYAFIDNELTVSQVVENGLKVFRAAVD